MDFEWEFTVSDVQLTSMWNSRGPNTEPWKAPCFMVLQLSMCCNFNLFNLFLLFAFLPSWWCNLNQQYTVQEGYSLLWCRVVWYGKYLPSPVIFDLEGQVAREMGIQVCRIGNRNWGCGCANGQWWFLKRAKNIDIKIGENAFLGGHTLKTEAAISSKTLTPVYHAT
jgi:hypothetical protein